jgi:hypothetical protein
MTASRQRLAAVTAFAVAAAVAALVLMAGPASGGDDRLLAWKGERTVIQSGPPTDHILGGVIRNDSLRDLDLRAEDVRILGPGGEELRSTARFSHAFAHGLYAWSQRPKDIGDFERRRLGEIVTLKPGQATPLTLSWRIPPGADAPRTVDFGSAALALP